MRYTEEQVGAIHSAKESVHVSACAGSGKTGVLAARVTKLLKSGVQPSDITAITYTDIGQNRQRRTALSHTAGNKREHQACNAHNFVLLLYYFHFGFHITFLSFARGTIISAQHATLTSIIGKVHTSV